MQNLPGPCCGFAIAASPATGCQDQPDAGCGQESTHSRQGFSSRHRWALRPAATFTETGNSTLPSPTVYSPTSRSKGGPDSHERLLRLVEDERPHPDGAAAKPLPQLIRAGHAVRERDGIHLDVAQAGALEETGELALVGKTEEWRAFRYGASGSAPASWAASRKTPSRRVRSGTSQVESATFPPGASTRVISAAAYFGRPRWRMRKFPTTASKEPSANGRRSALALHELEPRMEPAGERDHLPSHVDADRSCAARGGGRGRVAGAGRKIEHTGLRPDVGRVEQRLDHPRGERPEEAVVAPCSLVPSRPPRRR